MCSCSAESSIAWTNTRPRKRRARSRRRKARKSTRKSMRVVTAQVTPPAAVAVAATVAQIRKAVESSRAKIERRARKKIPVGITAPRLSAESRVKRPRRAGAGHGALAAERSAPKRSPEIIDRPGPRGDGAGVDTAARERRGGRTEVKRDGDVTAGTDREPAAPCPAWTGAGAAAEAKTGVAAETGRGAGAAQRGGRSAAGAGRGAGAGGGRGAKTEAEGSADGFTSLFESVGPTTEMCFIFSLPENIVFFFIICNVGKQSAPFEKMVFIARWFSFRPVEGSSGQKIPK